MISNTNLYAVALTFPGEPEILLSKLREPFRPHMHYAFLPHITLVYPFAPARDIEDVIARLEKVAAGTRPFRLTLEGINYFQTVNNVAYIAIKDREPVNILALNIVQSIKDVITGYYAEMEYDYTHYIPHMTIGEKIPAHIFPEVKKHFTDYQIHQEVDVTYFSLAGENNGLWEQLRTFKFKG